MSSNKNEHGRSAENELLNAIQIVCHEAAVWLEQRPEFRDAARTIFESIFDQSTTLNADKTDLDSHDSGDTPTIVENESDKVDTSNPASAVPIPPLVDTVLVGPCDETTNRDSQVDQSIDQLSAAIDQEISATDNGTTSVGSTNKTTFETAGVDRDFEPFRSSKPRYSEVSDNDLSIMVDRCRLKAEGARWAIERDERIRDGADFKVEVKPFDLEIIDRAKQVPNCFLWMNQPRSDIRTQTQDFRMIADCFDALAESITTLSVSLTTDDSEQFIQAVQLVAEAQSALRTAVARVEDHPDTDQQLAYHWLRNRASKDRFYISRFMKITDPADPQNCLNIQQQAIEFRAKPKIATHNKQRGSWLEKARFHLRKISSDLDAANEYDWTKVADAVEHWIEDGGLATSRELRDLLLPVIDEIPDIQFPASFESVIDVLVSTSIPTDIPRLDVPILERAIMKTNELIDDSSDVEADRSLEVKQVSRWLADKRVVLFAGEVNQELHDQIVQSFQLQSLQWVPPELHHAEIDNQLSDVDLIAVVVTNQWETLLWGEICETTSRMSVPCVRLPTTCTSHQIAVQVIKQCPEHLSDGDFQSSVA